VLAEYEQRPKPWCELQVLESTTTAEIEEVFGTGATVMSFEAAGDGWSLWVLYGGNTVPYSGKFGQYLRAQRTNAGGQYPYNALVMDESLATDPELRPR
jgi:hypothetical protein